MLLITLKEAKRNTNVKSLKQKMDFEFCSNYSAERGKMFWIEPTCIITAGEPISSYLEQAAGLWGSEGVLTGRDSHQQGIFGRVLQTEIPQFSGSLGHLQKHKHYTYILVHFFCSTSDILLMNINTDLFCISPNPYLMQVMHPTEITLESSSTNCRSTL